MSEHDPSADLHARIEKQFFGGLIPDGLEYGTYHMARDQHEQGVVDLSERLDAMLTTKPDDGGMFAGLHEIGHTPAAVLTADDLRRTMQMLRDAPIPEPQQYVASPQAGAWIQSVGGLDNALHLIVDALMRAGRPRRLHARRMHRRRA